MSIASHILLSVHGRRTATADKVFFIVRYQMVRSRPVFLAKKQDFPRFKKVLLPKIIDHSDPFGNFSCDSSS